MLSFRYYTLVPADVRGVQVQLQSTSSHGIRARLPFELQPIDAWLVRPSITESTRAAASDPLLQIHHQKNELVITTTEGYIVHRPAEVRFNMFLENPRSALAILAKEELYQIRAFQTVFEDLWKLFRTYSAEDRRDALKAIPEMIKEHHTKVFSTIWYDELLLMTIDNHSKQELGRGDILMEIIPHNGGHIRLMPPALRGAKRIRPEYVYEEVSVVADALRAHFRPANPTASNFEGPPSQYEQLRAYGSLVLSMSERLSQCWALLISLLSTYLFSFWKTEVVLSSEWALQ